MIIPIPIIIPAGYTYSCTVSGCTFKVVQCENCRHVYVYKMERTSSGSVSESSGGASPYSHAEAAATFGLRQKLREDCDAIPCLECGKYQSDMIETMRREFMLSVWYISLICLGAALLSGILSLITLLWRLNDYTISWTLLAVAVAFGAFGGLLFFWRRRQLQRFDPNSNDLGERMQIAARYAKTVEEFQAYLKYHGIEWSLPANLADELQSRGDENPRGTSEAIQS